MKLDIARIAANECAFELGDAPWESEDVEAILVLLYTKGYRQALEDEKDKVYAERMSTHGEKGFANTADETRIEKRGK